MCLLFTFSAFAQVAPAPSIDWVALLLQAPIVIGQLVIIFSAALVIALIIPGDQPDKFLQGALNLLKKFSKK